MSDSPDLATLAERQQAFLNQRDWGQFHTPKSLAMALTVEASELMELVQWHDNLPADAYDDAPEVRDGVREEVADVVIYTLSLASQFDIDLATAVNEKMNENQERFDEERAAEIREELERWTN